MEGLESENNQMLLTRLAGPTAAQSLMNNYAGLTQLAQASFDELRAVPGVGKSKAAAVKVAFLLAQRLARETAPEMPLLDSPDRVADLLREQNRVYTVEHLQVLLVNTRNRVIGVHLLAQGTLDTLLVDIRQVFFPAITRRAKAIVLVHNHPSGDPSPSEADIRVTRELACAGRILKIEVLDHIILGRATPERPRDYVSLRELGYFY